MCFIILGNIFHCDRFEHFILVVVAALHSCQPKHHVLRCFNNQILPNVYICDTLKLNSTQKESRRKTNRRGWAA